MEGFPEIPGYELRQKLGRGGMGVVYLAHELAMGREVALKLVNQEALGGHKELERFRNEARILANLSLPHVVTVYSLDEHNDRPYFTMEYLDGGSLAEITATGPIPQRKAAEIIEALARALDVIHN